MKNAVAAHPPVLSSALFLYPVLNLLSRLGAIAIPKTNINAQIIEIQPRIKDIQ